MSGKKMKVMVLAGGNDQIILIKEIRKKFEGAYVLLVDYYESPVAKKYADRHIQISTLDKELVLEHAERECIDRIYTACTDQALVTMAYVAEKMHLPTYLSYQQACCITNKSEMKQVMKKGEIPTSSFIETDQADAPNGIDLKFPLVLKPVDGNSSKGIQKVENRQGLSEAYQVARNTSRSKKVVIEEFFEGTEYSLDVWVEHGKSRILLATETVKNKNNEKGFQIVQSFYDYEENLRVCRLAGSCVQKLSELFQIEEGPMIVQLLVKGEDISVIELSARTGGGSKIDLIERLTGFNVISSLLDCIERNSKYNELVLYHGYASMIYVYMTKGTFTGISGLEELFPKTITEYFMYKTLGTKIEKAENSSDRVMGYLLMDQDREKLISKEENVEETLQILNEKNENAWIRHIYMNR